MNTITRYFILLLLIIAVGNPGYAITALQNCPHTSVGVEAVSISPCSMAELPPCCAGEPSRAASEVATDCAADMMCPLGYSPSEGVVSLVSSLELPPLHAVANQPFKCPPSSWRAQFFEEDTPVFSSVKIYHLNCSYLI